MIVFSSERVRNEFHLLPLERQNEIEKLSLENEKRGLVVMIDEVYRWSDTHSEIVVRLSDDFIEVP